MLTTQEGGSENFSFFTANFLSYLYLKQSVITRTARICSGTIRIGHFSCGTIEGGTPTQLAEYFVKRLSYETRAQNIISALHTPIRLVATSTRALSTQTFILLCSFTLFVESNSVINISRNRSYFNNYIVYVVIVFIVIFYIMFVT